MNPFLDENGEKVVHFAADVRNLGKLGELSSKIIEMAESGAWRSYRTAVGADAWRDCEFDYFLISCDVEFDDVDRAIRSHRLGGATRNMMNPYAEPEQRRTLDQAAEAWHSPGPGTLTDRAVRLGWVVNDKPRVPLPQRQLAELKAGGMTMEQQAQERRKERLPVARRRELDDVARTTFDGLDDDERRYLLDVMRKLLARDRGRPPGDYEQWAKDIAELDGDTKALAERWGASDETVRQRKASVSKFMNKITEPS